MHKNRSCTFNHNSSCADAFYTTNMQYVWPEPRRIACYLSLALNAGTLKSHALSTVDLCPLHTIGVGPVQLVLVVPTFVAGSGYL